MWRFYISKRNLLSSWQIALSALLILTIGCATKPSPTTDEVVEQALPENTKIPQEWSAQVQDTGKVDDGWIKTFNDPQLEELIEEALRYNLNLRQAAAQVDISKELITQSRSQLMPTVGAVAGGSETGRLGSSGAFSSGIAALDVSWELDVWGRIRSQVSATEAQFQATQADFEFARQSLAAQVAKSWFLATEAKQQMELNQDEVEINQQRVDLVQAKLDQGQVSRQDLLLANADLSSAQERLRQSKGAFDSAVRSLEVLLGRYPSAELEVPREFVPVPPPIPAGIPSEVLERRPDLVAAESRVDAAFQNVQAAELARLPRITLTGSLGGSSNDLLNLLGVNKGFWSAGANFFAPVFTGGALEAQVQIETAQQEAALANYGQKALVAFSEVETGLSNEKLLKEREEFIESSVQDNMEALDIANVQYNVGKVDMLSVLQMQLRVFNAKRNLIRIKNDRLNDRVNLHLALGGSFEENSI